METTEERKAEQRANFEALQKVLARTKECTWTPIDGDGDAMAPMTFKIRKLAPREIEKLKDGDMYSVALMGMVEPNLTKEQMSNGVPMEFFACVSKAINDFNGFDLKAIEKN